MLPVPFKTAGLPTWYQQGEDPARDAMCAKIDSHLAAWTAELIGMLNLSRPDRTPVEFLPELAYLLGATITQTDSERQQRQIIAQAGFIRRNLGLWVTCIKPLIDFVTGTSAVLWSSPQWDWWVWVEGDEGILAAYYWGTMGEGDNPNVTGLIMAEADVESINPGNVYIDVGTSTLTADHIQQIVDNIGSLCPAYMTVVLGWTLAGIFTAYPGGTIG